MSKGYALFYNNKVILLQGTMLDKETTTTMNEELIKLKKRLLRYQQKVTATTLQIRKLEAAKHTKFFEFFDITER